MKQLSASLVSVDTASPIDELRRDNVSLRARTRTMEAALLAIRPRADEFQTAPTVVGVFGQGQLVERLVATASVLEARGDVPAIRFVRNSAGDIVGVELATLARVDGDEYDDGAFDPTFRILALLATCEVSS